MNIQSEVLRWFLKPKWKYLIVFTPYIQSVPQNKWENFSKCAYQRDATMIIRIPLFTLFMDLTVRPLAQDSG